jgi:hypothetical protein
LIYQRFLAAGVFPHLSPHVEMPHRHLDHVKAIEHLIDILRADVLLRLFEDRAAVFSYRSATAARVAEWVPLK